jgi:DNA polymerase-1
LFAHLPVVQPLLRYKAVSKLIGTYGKSYDKCRHPITDRLHPEFALGFTRSGRVCASKPNTQQAPKQGTFRELFTAPPGMMLVSADYSQVELVVAALLSQDQAMLDIYRHGGDLHRTTAAAIAGVSTDAVSPKQRQAAKPVNFGNLYGQGAAGLARTAQRDYGVTMSSAEAKQALLQFDLAYPQLAQWKRQQVARAMQFRQVRTRLGLVRDFDAQGEGYLRGEAQNIPVQGSAAEVLMSALARLPQALAGLDAALYHTVHDEITLQVTPGDAAAAARALQEAMVQGFLDVFPEAADVVAAPETKIGPHWSAVH